MSLEIIVTEVTLESLVGEHELSGVDMTEENIEGQWNKERTYHGNVCRFVLDGKVYTALEDEDDGYRSSLRSLTEGGAVSNLFAPQRVLCSMQTEGKHGGVDDILVMRDVVTGKEVLSVGTDNTDDYYPSFVANFHPENMACNQQSQS
jgi:hypothetical protein